MQIRNGLCAFSSRNCYNPYTLKKYIYENILIIFILIQGSVQDKGVWIRYPFHAKNDESLFKNIINGDSVRWEMLLFSNYLSTLKFYNFL